MAQTTAQIQTKLDSVTAAIALAETAQAAGSDGTSLTRANLATLYKRQDDLQQMLEAAEAADAGYDPMFARGRTRFIGGI